MRILFVDHTPFIGGAQLVLASHIAALDKGIIDPHVACTDTVPEMQDAFNAAGAIVHTVPMPRLKGNPLVGFFRLLQASWHLREILKAQKIELIVTNTTRASYIATLASFGTNIPSIWYVRDFLYNKHLFNLLRRVPKKIIGVSQAIIRWYMPLDDPQAAVLYVASDLYKEATAITDDDRLTERQKYGMSEQDFVVGFMGRLVEEKGAQDVVAAVSMLVASYPGLKLLIVGTGEGQEHNIEPQLRKSVAQNGLADSIVFTGYQTNQALYYSLFNLFILSTRDQEPFATSVIQAMQSGVPVVGSNAGGTPEIIIHEQTGLLYAAGNVEDLAAAIRRVMDHESDAAMWATAAQQRAIADLNEDSLARQAEALYLQAVERRV